MTDIDMGTWVSIREKFKSGLSTAQIAKIHQLPETEILMYVEDLTQC